MFKIEFNSPVHVHFMGIGGISMSGLAEILMDRGFTVSGSDNKESPLTDHLSEIGAKVSYPQKAENITDDIDVVVYTAAIHPDNPEFKAAKEAGLPMLTRAELLGQIMENYKESIAVAGTHGKTTTSSMISQILLSAKKDPTISIGGILPSIKSNVHVGSGDQFVLEACEYTNSYHSFFPKYNVILNVEEDHMDFFKDLSDVRNSFRKFASNTSSDGLLVINHAIPDYTEIAADCKARTVTFGMDSSADYYPEDIRYNELGLASFVPVAKGKSIQRISLHVPGEHNILNALAAIAVCSEMGIDEKDMAEGFRTFTGADRRFQYKGKLKNGAIIIDDYAHHPTEIAASLDTARKLKDKRVVCIFQPHTYTRTKAFLKEFGAALSKADLVVLADIYAAREQDVYGVSSKDVASEVKKNGTESLYFSTFEEIEKYIEKNSTPKDLLITMGAGDVFKIGEDLLQ